MLSICVEHSTGEQFHRDHDCVWKCSVVHKQGRGQVHLYETHDCVKDVLPSLWNTLWKPLSVKTFCLRIHLSFTHCPNFIGFRVISWPQKQLSSYGERGYEQSGTDCAQGITPSCLFDNRSDLELRNRIGQKKLGKQCLLYNAEETTCKDNKRKSCSSRNTEQNYLFSIEIVFLKFHFHQKYFYF